MDSNSYMEVITTPRGKTIHCLSYPNTIKKYYDPKANKRMTYREVHAAMSKRPRPDHTGFIWTFTLFAAPFWIGHLCSHVGIGPAIFFTVVSMLFFSWECGYNSGKYGFPEKISEHMIYLDEMMNRSGKRQQHSTACEPPTEVIK